ncbi:MAG: TraB/GumN family protein [Pseudomonadota bacterium]
MPIQPASIWGRFYSVRLGMLALALCTLSGCFSEPPEPAPGTRPPLFQIINQDGEVEGWMLGTIHALPDGVAWRTDAIELVIDEADLLIVEVADLEDSAAIAEIVAELSISPDLPPITNRVSPSRRANLQDMIDRAPVTAEQLSRTETWAAALALARVDAQGDPRNGVDRLLVRDFDDREVLEFEGAVGQLTIFDNLPEADQRDLLEGVLDESQAAREDPGRLRSAWLAGDIAELEQATKTGIMADAELREALLVARNRRWTAKLSGLLRADDKPLIAVGAAHLVGSDSVPAMLEQRGYTITPLGR